MRNNKGNSEGVGNGSGSGNTASGATSELVNAAGQMAKLPFQMTGATWDLMMAGVRNIAGGSSDANNSSSTDYRNSQSGSSDSWTGSNTGGSSSGVISNADCNSNITSTVASNNTDLSGDDLKYVVWSIVFTKPGFECVLEPQRTEIVNYSADRATFAALKIAKFLERARHGHVDRSEVWNEHNYPAEPQKAAERRTDIITSAGSETTVASTTATETSGRERGWRIPQEDQKFITFIYRVDWRIPKQDDVVRVERVTIERGTATTSRV